MDNILKEIFLEDDFICIKCINISKETKLLKKNIDKQFLQFHFSLEGDSILLFNNGNYQLNISKGNYLTLYNPNKDLPLNINVNPGSNIISVLIKIERFHKLFYKNSTQIPFLSADYINQKYYKSLEIENTMLLVLNQILNHDIMSSTKELYIKGKIYQLFSLMFDKQKNPDKTTCPFLINDNQLRKINLAKEIIIEKYMDPPTLIELSEMVNLSLRKLKQGFKEVYGKPIFQYLIDYKMQLAKKFLINEGYNVNETSIKLGYTNSSHFIATFKKRFGVTPKVYMLNFIARM